MKPPQEFPFLRLSGGTMTGALNMGGQAITNGGDITAAHANGYMLENAAASSTNPTIVPDRNSPTNGIGTGSLIAGGVRTFGFSASDVFVANNPTNGMSYAANNGSFFYPVKVATTSLATTGGAGTQTASNLIPAGSIVHGIVVRVTTVITGCTTFSIGDGTDADRWGAGILVAANTTTTAANFTTANMAHLYATANNVVLTAAGGGGVFSTGAVRIVVYYTSFDAPTS